MTVTQQDMLDASALALGRYPYWLTDSGDAMEVEATAATTPPVNAISGFATNGALVAHVAVDLHQEPGVGRSVITIDSLSASASYAVTVDGQAASATADSDPTIEEVTGALVTDIDGLGITGVTVAAESVDEVLKVVVRGSDRRHLVEAGTNTAVEREATYARFRIWGLSYGTTRWRVLRPMPDSGYGVGADGTIEVHENAMAPVRVAGVSRVYVELVEVDGSCAWRVGLAQKEV